MHRPTASVRPARPQDGAPTFPLARRFERRFLAQFDWARGQNRSQLMYGKARRATT